MAGPAPVLTAQEEGSEGSLAGAREAAHIRTLVTEHLPNPAGGRHPITRLQQRGGAPETAAPGSIGG